MENRSEVIIVLFSGIVKEQLELLPSRLEGSSLAAGQLFVCYLSSLILLVQRTHSAYLDCRNRLGRIHYPGWVDHQPVCIQVLADLSLHSHN